MTGICDGRVVIVTGAGRGIGREHALLFAKEGAKVVVNDLGGARDGTGSDATPAQDVVAEIQAAGGEAVANADDVSSWDGAQSLIKDALDNFGRLDTLVNNAGILRDRMLVNMTEAEWDAVIKVHLKGTFGPCRFAAEHWRNLSKAGEPVDARIINTSSTSGIFGNPGQTNYGAAKAGIAAFTVILARELDRYGVRVNGIAPGALTRMTADLNPDRPPPPPPGEWNPRGPENIAPLVVWLGSHDSHAVTGRVFLVAGGRISLAEGWRRGPTASKEGMWEPAEVGDVIPGLLADAAEASTMQG
jgi:NAD(P)-dependent dehydrogenase (short-subunit alcohol dehydrogenase family)